MPVPRLVVRPLALAGLLALIGCSATPIPQPPAAFETVVVTSPLPATSLYADATAAFLRANWRPVTGAEGSLTTFIRPDGAGEDGPLLRVAVRSLTTPVDTVRAPAAPDLADADYAGPDLSNRDLTDPARGQNEPDSLRRDVLPDALTTGTAVLVVTLEGAPPGIPLSTEGRDVLVRTARVLAGVDGTISYR